MQNLDIVHELMRQNNKGTYCLYSKVPYRLRKRLDKTISSLQWDKINDGCELNDQNSLDQAQQVYHFVLEKAEEYINVNYQNRCTDNDIEMRVDKNNLENEFKDNGVRFVSEMAKCLKMEKELIFTYHESGNVYDEMTDVTQDQNGQLEDRDFKAIEDCFQNANSHILQAHNKIEEEMKFSEVLMKLYSSIPEANCDTEILENTDWDTFRNGAAANIISCQISQQRSTAEATDYKQKAIEALNEACRRCQLYVKKLSKDLDEWRNAEKLWSIDVGQQPDTGSLINKYMRFGNVINTVLSWFSSTGTLQTVRQREQEQSPSQVCVFSVSIGNLESEFQKIMNFLQLIVLVQPKGVISIENKGGKGSPNFCTKKTQSFSTTVRILAAECFSSFVVTEAVVELVAESSLEQKSNALLIGKNNLSCLKVEYSIGDTKSEIKFTIVLNEFSRNEVNNVYKQFFRLRYRVCGTANDLNYNLETYSLPFTFNTGANQILEHKGSRFWYLMSTKDMYNGSFKCPDPIPVDDVIQMLDERVACLGKGLRRLTDEEKSFLKGRLPVLSDGTVSMQGFLKDKMRSLRSDAPLSFSFYTWFYAVIHSIELLLLDAWQDGIIYGFCSEKHAEQLLMDENVPEGTFLLRPSVSIVNKTSSLDATTGLTIEVKIRNETSSKLNNSNYRIQSLPLFFEHIEENTLFDGICGIDFEDNSKCSNQPLFRFIYRKDGTGRELKELEKYAKKPKQKILPEYFVILENMKKLKFKKCSNSDSANVEASGGEEASEQEPLKRKKRFRKSSSNTQIQEKTSRCQPHSGASVQYPVSKIEDKQMPGTSNKKTVTRSDSPSTQWSFGQTVVDVSRILNGNSFSTELFNSDHGDQSSLETMQAESEITDFVAPSSSQNRSLNLLDTQNPNNGTRYYNIASPRSSSYSSSYYESVSSSPAPTIESSLQSPSSVSSNSTDSSHFSRDLSLQPNVQLNLPLILNEACESKVNQNRRGNVKGNKSGCRKKKSPALQSVEVVPQNVGFNLEQITQAQMCIFQNGSEQYGSYFIDDNQINIVSNLFSPFQVDETVIISNSEMESMREQPCI